MTVRVIMEFEVPDGLTPEQVEDAFAEMTPSDIPEGFDWIDTEYEHEIDPRDTLESQRQAVS